MGNHLGDRAVVLGGGIAGLLAARLLSEAYHRVAMVDRDELSDVTGPRRAVPQGHHIHALLGRGQQVFEELFPGFSREMTESGVPVGDFGTSLSWNFDGTPIRKTETGMVCVAAGRPRLESWMREKVLALPNVELRQHSDIAGLVASADRRRITGVRVAEGGAEEVLAADLVLDSTGRGSRTPRWLEDLGYPRVPEEQVRMDLTYTTCDYLRLPYDPIGDGIALISVATPDMPRGGILARLPDRYSLSLNGIIGDRPPTDREGFLAYAESLPVPDIYKAVRDAEPLSGPRSFRFPASIRRRYERLGRFPEGLLVMGDAACTFNPVYAQGMAVAATQSLVLRKHLEKGVPRPRRYFRDLARVIDAPWMMAAGADLGFPGVEGRRSLQTRLGNAYVPRVQAAAAHDEVLSRAFLRTAGLVDPPQTLMRPGNIVRVLRSSR